MELRLELLLGRVVTDIDGVNVGRIEEMIAEEAETGWIVTEFVLGSRGLIERLFGGQRVPNVNDGPKRGYDRIHWSKLDLSDWENPRLFCRREELLSPTRAWTSGSPDP